MRHLIAVRKACPEITDGSCHVLDTGQPSAFAHYCESQGSTVLAVHNLSAADCSVTLDLRHYEAERVTSLLDGAQRRLHQEGTLEVDLPPYGHYWFGLHGKVSF